MSENHTLMDKFIYLFEAHDNGYGDCERTYFSSNKKITQEDSDKFILSSKHYARRMGSEFEDFRIGAEAHGLLIDILKGQHKVNGVIQNITGSY